MKKTAEFENVRAYMAMFRTLDTAKQYLIVIEGAFHLNVLPFEGGKRKVLDAAYSHDFVVFHEEARGRDLGKA